MMERRGRGWLVAGMVACGGEPTEDGSPRASETLTFSYELAAVPVASSVSSLAFEGPSLGTGDPNELCHSPRQLRLIEVHRAAIEAGEEAWLELNQGWPQVSAERAKGAVVERLRRHAEAVTEASRAGCLSSPGLPDAPVLVAIEAGTPLSTAQLLLQALAEAGFSQVALLVDAEEVRSESDWSESDGPPVLTGPGLELEASPDVRSEGAAAAAREAGDP